MIWTFLTLRLIYIWYIYISYIVIYSFIFLKFSNLVPTTWFSLLAPPSPWNAQSSSLQGRLLLIFRVSAKMSLSLWGLSLTTLCKTALLLSIILFHLFFLIFIICFFTDSLAKQDESSTSVNPPINSQCLAWELIINTHLWNEWMIPSVIYVSNTGIFFINLS